MKTKESVHLERDKKDHQENYPEEDYFENILSDDPAKEDMKEDMEEEKD